MRKQRLNVVSSIWALLHEQATAPFHVATVISGKWTTSPDKLMRLDPRKLLGGFRTDLNRYGGGVGNGALIAFPHGEWEPNRGLYQLHCHVLAIGDALDALDRLRTLDKYKRVRGDEFGTIPIAKPIQIERRSLSNMPLPITYLLKSYWPSRTVSEVHPDGTFDRQQKTARMPEPYHSQVLLWQDQWCLKDMTLMMGMFVSKDGLRLRNPISNGN
jgi:hypothetical protein